MPASRLTCAVCRKRFYGRVDALYCSPVCRQRAYRERTSKDNPASQSRNDTHKRIWLSGAKTGDQENRQRKRLNQMDYEEKEKHERDRERLARYRELAAIQERLKSCSEKNGPRSSMRYAPPWPSSASWAKPRAELKSKPSVRGHAMGAAMLSAFDGLSVLNVTEALEEAAESERKIIKDRSGISREHLRQIEDAHDKFLEELNVLRMFEKELRSEKP